MQGMAMFKTVLWVMLFYSFAINVYIYALPAESINYVTPMSDTITTDIDVNNISLEVQSAVDRQTTIPIIEVGALVFYSGNILVDLFLNFFFALPEMVGFIIVGITSIFSINVEIVAIVQGFATAAMIIFYFLGILQFITGVRSGRVI
jgi:hypothetical protein